jgi:hypothetical protein
MQGGRLERRTPIRQVYGGIIDRADSEIGAPISAIPHEGAAACALKTGGKKFLFTAWGWLLTSAQKKQRANEV